MRLAGRKLRQRDIAASRRAAALETLRHGCNGGMRIGHKAFQSLEIGEDVARVVKTSLGCPRFGYSGDCSPMSDRVAQAVNRTDGVNGDWGKKPLHFNLSDCVSESEVALVILEVTRSLCIDPQDRSGEVLEMGSHADDVLPDLLVSAAVRMKRISI